MGVHRPWNPQRARVRGSGYSDSGGAVPVYTVFDTFTDTPATALPDHNPEIGGPWFDAPGAWFVQTPFVDSLAQADDSASVAFIQGVKADVRLTMYVENDLAEAVFRYVDANNYWVGRVFQYNVGNFYRVEVRKVEAGLETLEGQANIPTIVGAPRLLTVVVDGDQADVTYYGVTANATLAAPFLVSTVHGMRSFLLTLGGPSYVEHFEIEDLHP